MDVFVAYTKQSSINELSETLHAWDIEGASVAAIEILPKKYELYRRVTSEKLSDGDYIMAEVGIVPTYERFIHYAEGLLKYNPRIGLFYIHGALVCRKGIVDKWPLKETDFYIAEHQRAYKRHGFGYMNCEEDYCKRLNVA